MHIFVHKKILICRAISQNTAVSVFTLSVYEWRDWRSRPGLGRAVAARWNLRCKNSICPYSNFCLAHDTHFLKSPIIFQIHTPTLSFESLFQVFNVQTSPAKGMFSFKFMSYSFKFFLRNCIYCLDISLKNIFYDGGRVWCWFYMFSTIKFWILLMVMNSAVKLWWFPYFS